MRRQQEADDRLLAGDQWQDLGLVFPGRTGGIRECSALTHTFQNRLRRHGLPVIRWHALRRVFAAVLQDNGVPLERIRDLMGHSMLSVTESYAYTIPASLDRDMASIDQAFGAMGGRRGVRGDGGDAGTSEEARQIKVPPQGFEP